MTIYVVTGWRTGYHAGGDEDQMTVGMVTTDRAKAEAFKAKHNDPKAADSGKPWTVSPWHIREVEDGEEWPRVG